MYGVSFVILQSVVHRLKNARANHVFRLSGVLTKDTVYVCVHNCERTDQHSVEAAAAAETRVAVGV